jgi:hypothetical protein
MTESTSAQTQRDMKRKRLDRIAERKENPKLARLARAPARRTSKADGRKKSVNNQQNMASAEFESERKTKSWRAKYFQRRPRE